MKTTDVITVAMSRQDGARAAAEMVSDGRTTPQTVNSIRCTDAEWGELGFTLGDAAQSAFLGLGSESFSRHRQMVGTAWDEEHLIEFVAAFSTVARACLWAGGIQ